MHLNVPHRHITARNLLHSIWVKVKGFLKACFKKVNRSLVIYIFPTKFMTLNQQNKGAVVLELHKDLKCKSIINILKNQYLIFFSNAF